MIELPRKRACITYELVIHSAEVGRFKFYLCVSVGTDGAPVELWIDCAKEGTMLREFMHAWAATASMALQGGVPLGRLAHMFHLWRFEPLGRVEGAEGIPECSSILDLVARVIERDWPSFLEEKGGRP